MADVNPEIIGGIGISITGDYSSLQSAYTTVVGLSQSAGEDISDALVKGGAAGADLGDAIAQGLSPIVSASEDASGSLGALADSIDAAQGPTADLSDSAEAASASVASVGDAADTASGSVGDLGDEAAGAATSVEDLGTFTLDAADGADELSGSAGDAAGSLGDMDDAADGAASSAGDLGDELPDAAGGAAELGDSSEEAGGSLAAMAEQMVAVGEALVITEGMREFGSEALAAADSITTASIALTDLTGSATGAQETIEGLEQLGMQDGLAMPSLLTAAQRMTAILPPGADVATLLGNIADGAAVMGTGIDQAANRFDQLVNSTSLAARQLSSFGLSLTSVAAAMNQVDPSVNATATTVSAMWKAMDPGTHVQILQTALMGLAGTAEQVANQTFGGQWQQLADAWEAIMVQVGQAILPVISDLMALTKTEILPFIQELAADFNALPGPIKDVVVVVALAAAAVIPLAGAFSVVSLAIGGLAELVPNFTALMASLGVTSGTTAAAQTAEAAATATQGEAAAATVPELEAVTVATEEVGAAATESALQYDLFATSAIEANWGAQATQLELFSAAELDAGTSATTAAVGIGGGAGLVGTIGALGLALVTLPDYLKSAESALKSLDTGVSEIVDSLGLFSTASDKTGTSAGVLTQAWQGFLKAVEDTSPLGLAITYTQKFGDAVQTVAQDLGLFNPLAAAQAATLANLETAATSTTASQAALAASMVASGTAAAVDMSQTGTLLSVYNAATAAFDKASTARQAGTITAEAYEAAVDKLITAQTNYNEAIGVTAETTPTIAEQTLTLTNGLGNLASSEQIVAAQTDAQNDRLNTLSADLITAQQELVLTDAAQKQLAISATNGAATQGQLNTAMGATEKAANAVAIAQQAYDDEMVQAGLDAANTAGDIQKGMLAAMQNMAGALPPVVSQIVGLDGAITALQSAMPNFGIIMTALSTGPLAGLQSAFDEATAKVAKLQAQMTAGKLVGDQYDKALNSQLQALVALNSANAEEATGLQGATDAMSLATIAVAAAQAKFDTLNAAYQTNILLAPQVSAAQKALTTAQNELNAVVGTGSGLIETATQAQANLAGVIPGATAAIGAQTTALLANAAALQSVAAAVSSVESDFASAVGASTPGVQGFSAPAGYTAQVTIMPGTMGGASETVTFWPDAATVLTQNKAIAAQYYAAGYTPQYIAKLMNSDIATVCGWLGVPTSSAGMTQNMYANSTSGTTASTPTAGTSGSTGSAAGGVFNPLAVLDPNQGAVTSLGQLGATTTGSTTGSNSAGGVVLDPNQVALIETATQAVAAAQAKLDALNAAAQTNILLTPQVTAAQEALTAAQDELNAANAAAGITTGTTTTTGTTSTAAVPVTAATGAGTSAIDGGSYPAVTAHQATGEVWAVSTSGASTTGAGTPVSGTTAAITAITNSTATTASALNGVASATGTAAQQISTVAGGLVPINASMASVAAAVTTLVSDVGSALVVGGALVAGGNTSTAAAGVVSTAGISTAGSLGVTGSYTDYSGGNMQGPAAPVPPAPPGYGTGPGTIGNQPSNPNSPFGPTQINAPITVTVNGGQTNGAQLAAQIASQLVSTLRSAGARF